MILLDTPVALRLLAGDPRLLSSKAYSYIEDASHRGALRLSSISLVELSVLQQRGKVRFDIPLSDVFYTLINTPGLQIAPIDDAVALEAGGLDALSREGSFPGDENDRIICATTRALRATLVTDDPTILDFAESGGIRVIALE